MDKKEYYEFHRRACEKMHSIMLAKNNDYCGADSSDPFANFRRVEILGITDTARGFLVRMADKISRITSFVQRGELLVKDESVEDTLLDLCNYSLLLAGYLKEQRDEKAKQLDSYNYKTFGDYSSSVLEESDEVNNTEDSCETSSPYVNELLDFDVWGARERGTDVRSWDSCW